MVMAKSTTANSPGYSPLAFPTQLVYIEWTLRPLIRRYHGVRKLIANLKVGTCVLPCLYR